MNKVELALSICESTKKDFRIIYDEYRRSNNQRNKKKLLKKCQEKIDTFYFLIRSNDLEELIRSQSNNPFSYEDDSDVDYFLEYLEKFIKLVETHI